MKYFHFLLLQFIWLTSQSQPGYYKEATVLIRDVYAFDGKTIGYHDLISNKVQIFIHYSSKQMIFAKRDTFGHNSFLLKLEGRSSNSASSLVFVTPVDTMYIFNLPDDNVTVDLRNLRVKSGIYDLRDYLDTTVLDHGKCSGLRILNCAVNSDNVVCEKGGATKFVVLNKSESMIDLRHKKPQTLQGSTMVATLRPFIFSQILGKTSSNGSRVYHPLKICDSEGEVFSW